MSVTAPPGDGGRVSAWYEASRRRLGVSEDEWYSPAVEQLLNALADDRPLAPAVAELGNARGNAGFDLRETVTDLEALVEVLPDDEAHRLNELHTTAALSTWADAFIDRVHAPSCVDMLTGLVTPGYLHVRLEEIYRECADARVRPAHRYALVVARVRASVDSPFVRMGARIQCGRVAREQFPGGETAAFDDPDRLLVLAAADARLQPRVAALSEALDAEQSVAAEPRGRRCRIEQLPDDLQAARAMVVRSAGG